MFIIINSDSDSASEKWRDYSSELTVCDISGYNKTNKKTVGVIYIKQFRMFMETCL